MYLNKKISAFTIAELMVVLVLSGIIVSMALVVLNLVQKQVRGIENIQNKNQQLLTLERILWHDFNKGVVFYDKQKETLVSFSPLDTTKFFFFESGILRNKDTVWQGNINIDFYLDGIQVKEKRIDALEIFFSNDKMGKSIFVHKIKDAKHYMNQ